MGGLAGVPSLVAEYDGGTDASKLSVNRSVCATGGTQLARNGIGGRM